MLSKTDIYWKRSGLLVKNLSKMASGHPTSILLYKLTQSIIWF